MAESDSEDSELADLELENPNQFLGTPLSNSTYLKPWSKNQISRFLYLEHTMASKV